MLTAEQIQGANLKRTNISVNAEATKQRVEEILRPAKIAQKKAIRELAGVTAQVFHNIYERGNISIKMVIAISQTLNLNPFYITGKADEPGVYSVEALRDLLLKHGYRALVAELELSEKKKRPYNRREPAVTETAATETEEAPAVEEVQALPPAPAPAVQLEEAEQFALLVALRIRGKAGIDGAKERLEQINQLLLG